MENRYENATKILQNKTIELSKRLQTEEKEKMSLEESKKMCEQKLLSLDKKYRILMMEHEKVMKDLRKTENIMKENREQIQLLKNERDEYEKRYRMISEVHSHCRTRESMSHVKISEALNVAEAAMKEKQTAEIRERELRGMHENICCVHFFNVNLYFRGIRSISSKYW